MNVPCTRPATHFYITQQEERRPTKMHINNEMAAILSISHGSIKYKYKLDTVSFDFPYYFKICLSQT